MNAGTVDHIICLICLNRSASTIAAAKLVDSDRGDILSPKTAPDTIAPTTKAGFSPNKLYRCRKGDADRRHNGKGTTDRTTNDCTNNKYRWNEPLNTNQFEANDHQCWDDPLLVSIPQSVEPTNMKIKIGMIPGFIPLMIPS